MREPLAQLRAADVWRRREAEAHAAATAQCQQAVAVQARADLELLVRQLIWPYSAGDISTHLTVLNPAAPLRAKRPPSCTC